MIALYTLLFRLFTGEKYAPASPEDTRLWLSALAAVPPVIGVLYLLEEYARDAALILVSLGAVGSALLFGAIWYAFSRLPGIKSVCAAAILGWAIAFWVAFQINQ